MTVETEVANLTTAVDNLTAAVNVSKATLDAKKADAAASAATALTYQTGAQTAKTGAEAARDLAYGYQQSAASAVAYQNLAAIATSKAVTAVDVFVYDTSKDSDGGAWRKRCQHTSWYNETLNTATRGSRKDFPAVAVIVAEAAKVTIYDGDDPALPMWMVFNGSATGNEILAQTYGSPITAVSAVNGTLSVGTSANGAHVVGFVADVSRRAHTTLYNTFVSGIASRNGGGTYFTGGGYAIVNLTVNDVAMTVLPDAPIDPATGLPVPTIAVATDGGWSQIGWDGVGTGNVWDCTGQIQPIRHIGFNESNEIHTSRGYGSESAIYDILTADIIFGSDKRRYYPASNTNTDVGAPRILQNSGSPKVIAGKAVGGNAGLTLLYENPDSYRDGMVAHATPKYNTGWLPGAIKGAFLADTDTTALTGEELVTNGTFDTDTSGWTASGGGSLSVVGGALRVTEELVDGTTGRGYQVIPTVVGKLYLLSVDLVATSDGFDVAVNINTNFGGALVADRGSNTPRTIRLPFVATATSTYIIFGVGVDTLGSYSDYDNISVKLVDADRSGNNKNLTINGTITRSPVATGAELVKYGDFSAVNYLEQPYNSALDFGTGDFCVMTWINTTDTGWGVIMDRQNNTNLNRLRVELNNGQFRVLLWDTNGSNDIFTSTQTFNDGKDHHIVAIRRSGIVELWADGVLLASGASAYNLTNTAATTLIGLAMGSVGVLTPGALSLLRISATAPTAEQITKIYNDEKVLFQAGAQATLYGSSDAVTALAHDPVTDLLHVGTSAGRSVFQGLRRVSNTTTAVATAISASNGLVVDE